MIFEGLVFYYYSWQKYIVNVCDLVTTHKVPHMHTIVLTYV